MVNFHIVQYAPSRRVQLHRLPVPVVALASVGEEERDVVARQHRERRARRLRRQILAFAGAVARGPGSACTAAVDGRGALAGRQRVP